ncbi:hypothetical protein [Dactylosporangium sp. CA-139066]|uniref:hypothetical protein n=1 Tax=Dactylosporangium sp. CA-139066 TaxID=3239930 RepID=UPI003D8D33A3
MSPAGRRLAGSYADQNQSEWFLAVDTHNILGLHNPFFTDLQNASVGVNMMANTSILGLALPLLPITLLLGAPVSYVLGMTLALTGTAFGWYYLMRRDLHLSRFAAVLGGAFAAFAPPMISHANGHLNLISQFLIPFIVRLSLRLFRSQRPVRDGLWLGALIVYQVFITEENLLMTALALAIFVVCYGFSVRSEIRTMLRPFLKGIGTALAVSLPLLAYPLYEQFFGRQHYDSFGEMAYVVNGIEAFTAYSTSSIGNQGGPLLSFNWTEANAYFGWSLLILATAITVWLWKDRLVRSVALVGAICAILSLGPEPAVSAFKHPHPTLGVPGPWALFSHLPLFEAMNAGRLTFVTVVCLAVLLAVATDRVIKQTAEAPARKVRLLFAAAMASALVPLFPLPLPAHGRQPVPAFFTSGTYKSYVAKNHTVVPVPPLVTTGDVHALDWQVASDLAFRLPGGYFMGPVAPNNAAGNTPDPGPSTKLFTQIIKEGKPVKVTEEQKAAIIAELRRWQADAVVAYRVKEVLPQLQESLDPVFGSGQQVDDVWIWDVRSLTQS